MFNTQLSPPIAKGPILFGYCLDIFLYGILTVQTYLYYLAFPEDRTMTKAIVYFTYVIGTLQTALALHDFYLLFCTFGSYSYPDLPSLEIYHFGFTWFTIPVGGALVASAVQFLYALRIYVLSGTKLITIVVSMLAVGQLLCGIVSGVLIFRFPPSVIVPGALILPMIGGALGETCDLLIAIYMSFYLSKQMRGASTTTQVLVTKVVRLFLETGILTAGMAAAYVILFYFSPAGFMVVGLSLGKLYANSMLVLLNNRSTSLRGRNTPYPDFDIVTPRPLVLAKTNAGLVSSHSVTPAQYHPAELTPSAPVIIQ